MAKKIWTVTLADDLINSLRFDSANVLRRIIIGKGLNEAQSRRAVANAVRVPVPNVKFPFVRWVVVK